MDEYTFSSTLGDADERLFVKDQADIPDTLKGILFGSKPYKVVVAHSKEDVLDVVRYAAEHSIPIVPRGSATSPYGGVMPVKGGIVLDLSNLSSTTELDVEKGTIEVETGVRWAHLHELLPEGFEVYTYPTSWFSTVGGWISTGGYGTHSLRYGHLSKLVESLEVVDGTGNVRRIQSTDEEFYHHFGTEGQMGIVLSAVLKVGRVPPSKKDMLLFDSARKALEKAGELALREDMLNIAMFERGRMHEMNVLLGEELLPEQHVLLVESENGVGTDVPKAERWQASYVWGQRFFPLKPKKLGPGLLASEILCSIDVAPEYIEKAHSLEKGYGVSISSEVYIVGKNLALVVPTFITSKEKMVSYMSHLSCVLALTQEGVKLGGKPYGVGTWNTPYAKKAFSAEGWHALREYKSKVDPKGILNPGKFFSLGTRIPFSGHIMGSRLVRGSKLLTPLLKSPQKATETDVIKRAYESCTHCGACVSVCPAACLLGDERFSPRAKLQYARMLNEGEVLSSEEGSRLMVCLHCGECEKVCQVGIDLRQVWEALEEGLSNSYPPPTEEISKLIHLIESEENYKRLMDGRMLHG